MQECKFNNMTFVMYNISKICRSHKFCMDCMFYVDGKCMFTDNFNVGKVPEEWDIKRFEQYNQERINKIISKSIFGGNQE